MPHKPLPAARQIGYLYLIHLDKPLSGQASHYLGWCKRNVLDRLRRHRAGYGAKMLAAAKREGIEFDVVRTWRQATRRDERQLKNRANAWRLCPVCNPDHWAAQGANVAIPGRRRRIRR